MSNDGADQHSIEERIEEVEETVDDARETAEDVLGEERVDQVTDEAHDLFDDIDDAARDELAEVEVSDFQDVGAPIPTARQMVRVGIGAVPVFLGLVLLGFPGVSTYLAGSLLAISVVVLAVVTLPSRFRETGKTLDVAGGFVIGLTFGSVCMALIHIAFLLWNGV